MINMYSEYELIDMAKKSGMIPALIPAFIKYMRTGIKTPVDMVLKCFCEKHNGHTNYASWYTQLELECDCDRYLFIQNKIDNGSWTGYDLMRILEHGVKHPYDTVNPVELRTMFIKLNRELKLIHERPIPAVDWYNVIENFINTE